MSSDCSEPMFIGVWGAQTGLLNTPLPVDPFGFLVDYSQATWGPDGSGAHRAWSTNDAGDWTGFGDSGIPPTFWFQVGVPPSSDAYPLPCYPLAVMSDIFRRTANATALTRVDFSVPLHQLEISSTAALPSRKLDWLSGSDALAESTAKASIEIQSGMENAFCDDVLTALKEVLADCSDSDLQFHRSTSGEPAVVSDGIWQGPGRSFLTTSASVSIGSLPRIGWRTGLIAEALASRGVKDPVYISWRLEH